MAYPPLNTTIQTTIACGHFFSGFFSPRAAPGIQIDENRENKEKTGRGRKQRIKNEYRAAPRRFRAPCSLSQPTPKKM
jgi:hypothetical protein